jgi:hypothetical protein
MMGRNRQRARPRYPASSGGGGGPDFTLSNSTVTTTWDTEEVGDLIPNGATPAGAYFLIVEDTNPTADYSGVYVRNG